MQQTENKIFRILFYPQTPSEHSTIYKLLKFLKYEIVDDPEEQWDLAISWEDTTFRNKNSLLKNSSDKIINYSCNDISKETIDRIFESVFHYSSFLDPTTFNSKCVKKSNLNAKHDGHIIHCPIESKEKGFVYQKLINNKNNDWGTYDIRTPIINQSIPFVLIKLKTPIQRFEDYFISSSLHDTNAIFSPEEIVNILDFCQKLGLDYGELDILRDTDDGALYIIDANNTPWWCPSLPDEESKHAIEKLASIFKNEFCTL